MDRTCQLFISTRFSRLGRRSITWWSAAAAAAASAASAAAAADIPELAAAAVAANNCFLMIKNTRKHPGEGAYVLHVCGGFNNGNQLTPGAPG